MVWRINARARARCRRRRRCRRSIAVGNDKGRRLRVTTPTASRCGSRESRAKSCSRRVIAEGVVIVWSGDGTHLRAVNAADGKTKWVYRAHEPAADRSQHRGRQSISRGGVFTGTRRRQAARHRSSPTGNVGLGRQRRHAEGRDRARAHRRRHQPAGRRRTGRSVRVAYQGRVACFDMLARHARSGRATCRASAASPSTTATLYVTDDKGAVQALDEDDRRVGVEAGQARLARARRTCSLSATTSPSSTSKATCTCSNRDDGALVGRIATDGSAPTAQPAAPPTMPLAERRTGRSIRCSARLRRGAPAAPSARSSWRRRPRPRRSLPMLPRSSSSAVPTSASRRSSIALTRRATRWSPTFPAHARPPLRRGRVGDRRIPRASTPAASSRSRRTASCTRWRKQTRQAIAESRRRDSSSTARAGLAPQDTDDRRSAAPVGPADRARREQGRGPARRSAPRRSSHELGLGEPHPISSAHGENVSVAGRASHSTACPRADEEAGADRRTGEPDSASRSRSSAGPNVGKSTLVNTLLGEERVIAFDEPGTTRDSIYLEFERERPRGTR